MKSLASRWKGWSPWKRRLSIAGAFVVLVVAGLAVTVAAAGPFFWYPCSLDNLEPRGQAAASYVYGADGTRIGTLGASLDRVPVSYTQISPTMRAAIVAVEDRRFYEHGGVDYHAIVRALVSDVGSGSANQGGSTLTQQLVRNLYLTDQRSLGRKLTEACLAVKLDRKWSKDKILTAYLNHIYFGHRAYGIEAASRAFFGVKADNLTLPQAALLAGMPQSPSYYDPFDNPDAALRRRAEVLRAMRSDGAIGESAYQTALAAPLGLHPHENAANGRSYLTDYIAAKLIDRYGAERVRRGGLRVYTTLDARLQREAEQAITHTLNRKGDPAGALVSIDPKTGGVRAMAVAQTGHRLAFNIAAQGRRQAGSTFKAFVLTEAVQRGINPWATKYLSAPFTGPRNWHVETYEHTYSGKIPLASATLASDNTVFARLTLDMGPKRIAQLASNMGIRSELKPIPPIGLGVNPVTPIDMAGAYSTLAANGVRHPPRLITRVVFPGGRQEHEGGAGSARVLDGKVVAQVTKILTANVRGGTGTAAQLSGRPAAGKTGTTDSYADAWFAGYVPQLATVVWVGYPEKERPMRDVHGLAVAGGTFPAQIWHTFMTAALDGKPVVQFADPGAPPFQRWCGRYQFARTAADAKPANVCASKPTQVLNPNPTTSRVQTESTPTQTTATPTQTAPTATAPPPPPSPTTTDGSGTQPDAQPAVGKSGTVVQDVDAAGNGIVEVGGKQYKAMNADDPSQTIPAGTQVVVDSADGDIAYVRPKDQQPQPQSTVPTTTSP